MTLTERWSPVFSIDLRSLAALRIALGVIILADLWIRGSDLSVWLSDDGVFPRVAAIDWGNDYRWSLYFLSGSWVWALFLNLIAALAALALILGYRTQIATIVSLILLVSLHNRASLLLQGGDNLLLLLIFWSLFLPLGARFSLDAARVHPDHQQRLAEQPNQFLSVGTVAILLQAMAVYFFSAFLKSGSEWFEDGTAIYYALHLDELATDFAVLWRDMHWLTVPLTRYVWWLELLGPILMFSPVLRVPVRLLIMAAFISMEIGFIFNLHIGLFPYISIASILLFMPSEVWNRLAERFDSRAGVGLLIYYDQDCTFCLKMCWILKTFLGLKHTRIEPAQSVPEVGEILEREFSWVVVDPAGETHIKWQAMTTVFSASPWFFWLGKVVGWPDRLGDRIYDSVATHRGAWGRWFALLLPWTNGVRFPGRLSQTMAGLFLIFVLVINLASVPSWRLFFMPDAEGERWQLKFPKVMQPLKWTLRLDQKWSMFAPYPTRSDGWLVVPGILASGKLVDVYHEIDQIPSFDKPDSLHNVMFENYRWRKYLSRVGSRRYLDFRKHYGSFLCRRWNQANGLDDRLTDFNIYRLTEKSAAPGQSASVKRTRIWRHWCVEDVGDLVEPALKAAGAW